MIIGNHLVPTPSQAGTGSAAWTNLFVQWDWANWVKPQIDKSVACGARCIGLIGCMDGVHSGAITQATVNSRWTQLASYCAGLGVTVYPKPIAFNQMTGVTDNEAATYVLSILGALKQYTNVVGCDIIIEADTWDDGAGRYAPGTATRMLSIYRLVKPGTSVPLTFSVASEWKYAPLRTWMAQWASTVDYLDFHPYAMNGWRPTLDEAGYWFSTYSGKNIWLGEAGSPQSDSVPAQNSFLGGISSLVASDSRFLGWIHWAAQDQDPNNVLSDQWGLCDANWNVRFNKAAILSQLGLTVAAGTPPSTPVPPTPGVYMPPATSLTDGTGGVWTNVNTFITLNGSHDAADGGYGDLMKITQSGVAASRYQTLWYLWTPTNSPGHKWRSVGLTEPT